MTVKQRIIAQKQDIDASKNIIVAKKPIAIYILNIPVFIRFCENLSTTT